LSSNSEKLWFSDRLVRDHLKGKRLPLDILSTQLNMDINSVALSLIKLYRNGLVDYQKTETGCPVYYLKEDYHLWI